MRDLPVLRAIVEAVEESGEPIVVNEIMSRTGLDGEAVQKAFRALSDE